MNKAFHLLDESYMGNLLREKVLPLYPDFKSLLRVDIKPYKKLIWETTYHVVVKYKVHFLKSDNSEAQLLIVCSAHSDENRENVYHNLKYLWDQHFATEDFAIPHPLFYSQELNGAFYRALEGRDLLSFIKNNEKEELAQLVERAGRLFARLHSLPFSENSPFYADNAHIMTVVPGAKFIFSELKERFSGRYYETVERIYRVMDEREESFRRDIGQRWLVHGDAHPENIIKVGDHKIGLIDFTDFCWADFTRDLGAFTQQLVYKIENKLGDFDHAKRMKAVFLDSYFKASGLEMTPEIEKRLDFYHNFTALRTATYWLLKHDPDPERAENLLAQIQKNLGI